MTLFVKLIKQSFLFIIPILVIIYFVIIDKPLYCGDPDYVYFFNGLNLNLFKLPFYTDHPGTPLIILAAIGIRLIFIFSGKESDIQTDFILHPASYEVKLHLILFSLVLLSSIISGYFIYKKCKNIPLTILLQAAPLIFFATVTTVVTRFIPDSFLLIIVFLISPFLFNTILKKNGGEEGKIEIVIPVLCGLGLAVKVIFFPFVLLALMICGLKFKKIKYFIGITILSFIVFTIPVVKQYPHMFKWFCSLLLHSGIYGQGAISFVNPNSFIENIKYILFNNHLMSVFLFIISGLFVYFSILILIMKNTFSTYMYKIYCIFLITLIFSIIFTAKHFDGKDYYLIITYCLTSISVVYSGVLLAFQHKFNKLITYFLAFCFIIFVIIMNFEQYKNDISGWEKTKEERMQVEKFIKEHSTCKFVTFCSYTMNKEYALFFGNIYSNIHLEKLKQIYSEQIFLTEHGEFKNWDDEINIDSIICTDTTYIVDKKMEEPLKFFLEEKGYSFKIVLSNRTKMVYELKKSIAQNK